jgi:hypothetical protein
VDTPLSPEKPRPAAPYALGEYPDFLLGLLFAAVLVLDLAGIAVLRSGESDWPSRPAVVAMGFAFAQTGLVAVLLALGGGLFWTRAALAAPVYCSAACLGCHAARHTSEHLPVWFLIMLVDGAVVAAPLVVARLAGLGIVRGAGRKSPSGSRQFTILGVLTLTTIVAILLGLARLFQFPWHEIGSVVLFSLAAGGIPWLGALITLSDLSWLVAGLAMTIYCPLAGWLISLTGFPPPDVAELIVMSCLQGAITIAACAVARIAGYRLTLAKP